MPVRLAETDADIAACFDVMAQLRTHLSCDEFVPRVRRQMASGYRLAFVETDGRAVAAAGYRLGENLAWGRFLYVDDLVTDDRARSRGHGQELFDWLVAQARAAKCDQLHLDSGVQRYDAHRFYLRNRIRITSHHFSFSLTDVR
jgi:GNAT superfamily N-acetyltransferase